MKAELDLRAAALKIFDAAVTAADPGLAMRRALARHPLPVPDAGGRLIVIAVGKAAPAMLGAVMDDVAGTVEALCVTHHENDAEVAGARMMRAGHPLPDEAGLKAGQAVMTLLQNAGAADRIVVLISGGGSALLPAPVVGVNLADKIALNDLLLKSGLGIEDMNLIRQQVSQLKGGGLARMAAPAGMVAYALSDVIGDDLRAVASGPTLPAIGTRADARRIMDKAGIWADAPVSVRAHLDRADEVEETPEVPTHLVGSNGQSLQAALAVAGAGGVIVNDRLIGDVGDAAAEVQAAALAADRSRDAVLIFGGETTVKLQGDGLGGRNQELALRVAAMAADIPGDWVFLSGGTDGRDGPTEAAGGIVDAGTAARITAAGLDVQALLANNDSNAALAAVGDLIVIGATGTNVADVQVMILPATHPPN